MSLLSSVGVWIWETSWQAAVIVALVLAAQFLLGTKLSASWRYLLWFLVVARLLLPLLPESRMSLYNLSDLFLPQRVMEWGMDGAAPGAKDTSTTHTADNALLQTRADYRLPNWKDTLVLIWLAGVCFFARRVAVTYGGFRRRLGDKPIGVELQTLLEEAARELRVRTPRCLETDAVQAPAVIGLFRPLVLLPSGMERRFSRSELHFILLHELAHIKRGDLWAHALVQILQVLHWFNPVLWFAFRRMRHDREMACDAFVLQTSDAGQRRDYGSTLLKIMENTKFHNVGWQPVGILENHDLLRQRMQRIVLGRKSRVAPVIGIVLAGCIGIFSLTGAEKSTSRQKNPLSRENAAFQRMQHKLDSIIIPRLDFRDVSLGDAIQAIRKYAAAADTAEQNPEKKGVNVVLKLDPQSPPMTCSISLTDIPLRMALQLTAEAANYKMSIQPHIIVISKELDTSNITKMLDWIMISRVDLKNATVAEMVEFFIMEADKHDRLLAIKMEDSPAISASRIDLQLSNVSMRQALEMVAEAMNCNLEIESNAVNFRQKIPTPGKSN